MKWLIITDNKDIETKCTDFINSANKKNKLLVSPLTLKGIKEHKKSFKELGACIIYATDEKSIDAPLGASLSSIFGFFASDGIKVYTNVKLLFDDPVFGKDNGVGCENVDELYEKFTQDYNTISDEASMRLAKQKLLDRGIPYTADCFGTYIAKNKPEIVHEFLEAGMSINARDDTGTPMLNIACRNDNFEFVEMIFDLGAELNAVSEDRGYTAVMDAVWRGNEKITKYLISKGADLNTINKEGQNNLILAVGANRESLVKLLAENGADPDVKDMMGMSAYNYAVLFKKQRLVEILEPYHKAQ
ncbi:Ankyrin repeat-containing protein [Treponema bryantii]|uniref:Ankyrin repeat-containing protein n=1 Tax=Treponema bryantii TaxID=163 RepID=A0A1I3KA96_9SPIR|nr:ankyrin repeat domain-containing protein [Treponema bryantii]SFI69403.1 Ankyrin repeat-containing protein [Treponema bryantii]